MAGVMPWALPVSKGLPGVNSMMMKVTAVMASNVGMNQSTRLMVNRSIRGSLQVT
jgi:hypothetical protein